jgi:hypothetical protein
MVAGMVDLQARSTDLGEPFDLGRLSARGTVAGSVHHRPLALDGAASRAA